MSEDKGAVRMFAAFTDAKGETAEQKRIAELEADIAKALKHADGNGMAHWKSLRSCAKRLAGNGEAER